MKTDIETDCKKCSTKIAVLLARDMLAMEGWKLKKETIKAIAREIRRFDFFEYENQFSGANLFHSTHYKKINHSKNPVLELPPRKIQVFGGTAKDYYGVGFGHFSTGYQEERMKLLSESGLTYPLNEFLFPIRIRDLVTKQSELVLGLKKQLSSTGLAIERLVLSAERILNTPFIGYEEAVLIATE